MPSEPAAAKRKLEIRQVWAHNVESEFALIRAAIECFPYVAMDTEFPGVIHRSAKHPALLTAAERYALLKANVDALHLIQVGLTLAASPDSPPALAFEINLREFDPRVHRHAPDSIRLLASHGLDLDAHRARGVDARVFAALLMSSGLVCCPPGAVTWVTFHSAYDFGYLIKLLIGRKLPRSMGEFLGLVLSKREIFQDLAPLLWHSFGTVAALLQEIVSIYPALSPPTLSPGASNRVCNALALLQCVASHPETRILFLNAHIPLYLYPFLNTTSKTRPFEYLRLTSLGVIGALVKVDDTEVISFLLQTEIIPLCLRTMEMGSELSKTVATFIVQKILLDDVGLRYICATAERFFAVGSVLANMVVSLADQPSTRLLKHIIRCYLRLSDNPRACAALQSCLPDMLKDGTFNNCLRDDPATRRWLQQLLHNVTGGGIGGAPQPGLDHMMGM